MRIEAIAVVWIDACDRIFTYAAPRVTVTPFARCSDTIISCWLSPTSGRYAAPNEQGTRGRSE